MKSNEEIQKLFDDNQKLVGWAYNKLNARNIKWVEPDDVLQELKMTLWDCCRNWNPARGSLSFYFHRAAINKLGSLRRSWFDTVKEKHIDGEKYPLEEMGAVPGKLWGEPGVEDFYCKLAPAHQLALRWYVAEKDMRGMGKLFNSTCGYLLLKRAKDALKAVMNDEKPLPEIGAVQKIWARMDEDEKQILIWRYWEEKTLDEIAELLGTKREKVRARVEEILAKMHRFSADYKTGGNYKNKK